MDGCPSIYSLLDETENNISDNVRLNESESEQKELSCDLDGSGTEAKNCVNNPNSDNLHLNDPRNEEDKLPCSSDKVEERTPR